MVGNGEQMRIWGGWKGLPLHACHWSGMTAFSPEIPSSLLHPSCSPPLSSPSLHLCSPPSLSCLAVALPITTGALAIALAIWTWRGKKHFFFLFFRTIFFHHLSLPWMFASSFYPTVHHSVSHLPDSITSASSSSLLAGYAFLQHATSVHHPDLCNGAAPVSC